MGNSLKPSHTFDVHCERQARGEAVEQRDKRTKEVPRNRGYDAAESFDPWKIDEGEDLSFGNIEVGEEVAQTSPKNGSLHSEPYQQSEEHQDECDDDSDISATVDSNTSLKESRTGFLKSLQGPPITFRLILDPTREKSSEEKALTVNSAMLALSVEKLKLCIEHHHSIPACIQTVMFDNDILEDHKLLSDYYLREGDTIRVSFDRTGDLTEIMEIIDSMKATYIYLKSLERDLRKGTLKDTSLQQISKTVCSQEVESLPEMYFASVADQAEVNRVFFVDCGGVRMCHSLHKELLKYPWSHLPLKLQSLELAILRSFWNLTADFSVRMSVLHKSMALQNIIKSFLRIRIEDCKQIRAPISVYHEPSWRCHNSAVNLPFKAMGALCNLAEIPECHMKIASNKALLKQLVSIMSCPNYKHIAGMISIGGMLCLAHSSCTHKYLAALPVVVGITDYCHGEVAASRTRAQSSKLIQYFAIILYTIILTTSPHLVDTDARLIIMELCRMFYEDADYMDIRQDEIKNGFKWSTLIPYMKLAYHPHAHPERDLAYNEREYAKEMKQLNRYCIESGIFSLSNMLQCSATRDIFINEGLLDFLVCMPWLYPRDWPERRKARELVSFMGQHVQLQPPSLINLTKARLAAMYFGLEKVISADSVHELLAEVQL